MQIAVRYQAPVAVRKIAPEQFDESQLGWLPGRVEFLPNDRRAFLDTLDGWVHVYEPEFVFDDEPQSLDGLRKFVKKITRPIRRVFKKIVSIPKKLFSEIKQHASKLNERRKKLFRSITKNKYTRQLLRVAGVALTPFTAGLSLAVAEGAARYGKARYVQGASRSSAWKRGATGAAIGYAGGRAISAGYQAVQRGGLTALNPFASTGATAGAQTASAAGTSVASAGTGVASGAVGVAQTGSGLWSTIGSTALKTAGTIGKTIATGYLTQMAMGVKPQFENVAYDALADQYLPDEYKGVYDSWANSGYGQPSYDAGAYEMPFGTEVPDGEYFTEQNGAPGGAVSMLPIIAVVSVVAAGGYLMFKK